ncbi:MAG: hypothetical protein ACJ78V_21190, partial [Myxococcales bacterium]
MRFIARGQSDVSLDAADVPVANQVTAKLRDASIDTLRNANRLTPSVAELPRMRRTLCPILRAQSQGGIAICASRQLDF